MRRVVPVSGPTCTSATIWTNRTLTSATGTCQSRAVKSCEPSGSRNLAFSREIDLLLLSAGRDLLQRVAAHGRRPAYHALRNGCRGFATGCGSACLSGFRAVPICHRLPLVAPAELHKCSIPSLEIADGERASDVPPCARRMLSPSV